MEETLSSFFPDILLSRGGWGSEPCYHVTLPFPGLSFHCLWNGPNTVTPKSCYEGFGAQ